MDHVDSLNEIMPSALQNTSMTDVDDVNVDNAVVANSPVIAVAGGGDLPSFNYFVSEQAKSMVALQELQNKVGALLEFRDLLMETFPQLDQRLQNVQSQSPLKWEPGIRVKRKLGQQLRDPDILVPSLLPRYRNSNQGKGSSSSRSEMSGSTGSNSAIQDSGFCTESSKDHLSAMSGRSKSRDTADELFSLLDNIHSKGTRLKLEVEYLKNGLHRKAMLTSLASVKRRCKSLSDLISANNAAQSFDFEYAMRTTFLENELAALKEERDLMTKKMNEIETEHLATLADTNRLEEELIMAAADKRYFEERLQDAIHSDSHLSGHHETNNLLARNHWATMQTPFAKCQLLKLMQVFQDTNWSAADAAEITTPIHPIPSPSSRNVNFRVRSRSPLQESHNESPEEMKLTNPIVKELNDNLYQSEYYKTNKMTSTQGSVVTLASTKDFTDTVDCKQPALGHFFGKPDTLIGFLSGHQSSLGQLSSGKKSGVTLSKEKVFSILNENNVKELRCFLLTLSYQVETLNVHVQRISKSRTNVLKQLNKYKFENEDLKLELKKKEIELEGTKAQKRLLEQKRATRFSYSTSNLIANTPKTTSADIRMTNPSVSYSISSSTLITNMLPATMSSSPSTTTMYQSNIRTNICDKAMENDGGGGSGSYRRVIGSKIPLKTYSSKLLNKSIYSGKKTLTSFRECSSAPSHNSCISSTWLSLNK